MCFSKDKRYVVASEERLGVRVSRRPLFLCPHGRWGSQRNALRFRTLSEARDAAIGASNDPEKRVTVRCSFFYREFDRGIVVWASDNREHGFEKTERVVTPESVGMSTAGEAA